MKCAIITIHDTLNYGSTLQTYGLYYGLKELGIDAEVIDYQCEKIHNNEFDPFKKKSIFRRIILNLVYGKKYKTKYKYIKEFFERNIVLSKKYTKANISEIENLYDKFLIGSDMVWNTSITGDDYTYFLDFVHDVKKKYAYSASFGDFKKEKLSYKGKELLEKFRYLSVREDSTAKQLTNILGKQVTHLQDPTVLIDTKRLNELADRPKLKKYVLIYYNDGKGKIFKDAVKYAKDNNLDVYFINIGLPVRGIKNIYVPSIEKFLGLIKYADAIFTASYHGMLMSIYFNKNFWYYNTSQFARMDSVARTYGIEGRDAKDILNLKSTINYEKVNTLISKYRQIFLDELSSHLC